MNTSRWPYAFFGAAAFYAMVGVTWGLAMSISKHHETYSAHAHLNLLGWVSLALMGTFYALLGQRVANWVKLANFVLSNVGVVCMISGLFMYLGRPARPPSMGRCWSWAG
jgi:membrane protein required for beta-lactamase induction